jgi:hypothetical protein
MEEDEMAITLPVLDDLDFNGLVNEAVTSIPTLYPAWTNYNPSDPGITLVELFAWLADMMIYRTGQIPDETYWSYLTLLGGTGSPPAGLPLDQAIQAAVAQLRVPYRAVTAEDYETLVNLKFPGLALVDCLPEFDVTASPPCPKAANVSVIVAPTPEDPLWPWTSPSPKLVADILHFLGDDRRLITTFVRVAGPSYVRVWIKASLYLTVDASRSDDSVGGVVAAAKQALVRYFNPWAGYPSPTTPGWPLVAGTGWPIGRWVHASEICTVLSAISGVDHVGVGDDGGTNAILLGEGESPPSLAPLVALELDPYQMPMVLVEDVELVTLEPAGTKWTQTASMS